MKKCLFITLLMLGLSMSILSAQEKGGGESFGNTLNLGLGLGYYGYVGHFMPVVHANYEIQAARNFTLAPFVTIYSYRSHKNNDYYRQSVMPVGVKGSYYFDQLLGLNSQWDLYAAGSLGFVLRRTSWENGFDGPVLIQRSTGNLYLDGHLGAEYHLNSKAGLFLGLSTGLSTFGVAIHL